MGHSNVTKSIGVLPFASGTPLSEFFDQQSYCVVTIAQAWKGKKRINGSDGMLPKKH